MPFFFSILPLANFFFYLRFFANYTCLELLISGRSNSLTRFADQLVGQEVPKTRENLRGLSNWDVMRGDHRVIELIRPRRPLLSMVIVSLLDRFWTNKDREREYFFPKFVKNSSKESIIDLNLWSFDKSIIIEYFYEIKIRKRVETNYKKKKKFHVHISLSNWNFKYDKTLHLLISLYRGMMLLYTNVESID